MTPLELKMALRSLEERVKVLEDRPAQPPIVIKEILPVEAKAEKIEKGPKMCPKCGKKKAYFFHVKSCRGP